MAYFLFLDESGHDHKFSPYEVLAGIAIEDRILWRLICDIKATEIECFGTEYSRYKEIKAERFLVRSTFRKAGKLPEFDNEDRRKLAKQCLEDGANATFQQITALEQAKILYVRKLLNLCSDYRCKVFATIIRDNKPIPFQGDQTTFLRKEHVYLFERFYYFLEEKRDEPSGVVVFDEIEKTQSRLLTRKMEEYFKKTDKGRLRSNLIVPEPFFVHSDLTTGIQLADLIAYTISWGFRIKGLNKESRDELAEFIEQIKSLRNRLIIDGHENWSIVAV